MPLEIWLTCHAACTEAPTVARTSGCSCAFVLPACIPAGQQRASHCQVVCLHKIHHPGLDAFHRYMRSYPGQKSSPTTNITRSCDVHVVLHCLTVLQISSGLASSRKLFESTRCYEAGLLVECWIPENILSDACRRLLQYSRLSSIKTLYASSV